MRYCTYCGKENREQARFCGHCGQPFTVPVPVPKVFQKSTVLLFLLEKSWIVLSLGAIIMLLFFFPWAAQFFGHTHTLANKQPAADKGITPDAEKQVLDKTVTQSDARQKLGQMGTQKSSKPFWSTVPMSMQGIVWEKQPYRKQKGTNMKVRCVCSSKQVP